MKETLYAEGGRPFYDDDIQTIQDEGRASVLAVLAGLARDCVVSGCAVSGTGPTYTVSPGVVYLSGQLLRFQGASGVSLPASLVTGSISVLDERTYQTGDTKTCIQEQFVELNPSVGSGVPLYPTGGLTLAHMLRSQVNEVGDVKWGQLVSANYDAAGLGLPGTVAWGWGLCNGQGGRIDLRGRFVAGYDPDRTDYAAVGKTGGEEKHTLTVDELPVHRFAIGEISNPGNPLKGNTIAKSDNTYGGSFTRYTDYVGGGQPNENRPPFYVLAARQWVGF